MRHFAPWTGCPAGCLRAAASLVVAWAAWQPAAADVLLRAPRAAQSQFGRACEAAAEGRFAEAFLLIEGVLAGGEDGFIGPAADGVRRTLRGEATALLASLPPRVLAEWETWYGGRAREALEAAARRRDPNALIDLVARFPLTTASEEAVLVLACDALDRNRPLEALAWLRRRAWNRSTEAGLEPMSVLLTAAAHLMAGQQARAGEVLAHLPSLGQDVCLRVGNDEFSVDEPERLLLALAANASSVRLPSRPEPAWSMFRGNPARNATTDWPGTIERPLWHVNAGEPQTAPTIPSGHPLVSGSLVLAQSAERLVAIDAPTGRQLWEYPWGGNATRGTASLPQGRRVVFLAFPHAHHNTAQGQITADGRRVFLIEGVPAGPGQMSPRTPGPSHNRLVALSVEQEGKLVWSVGTESGDDEPRLAGAYFLGPPLICERRLFVLAELDNELRLCTLDASTGCLEWSLPLAVPEAPIGNDPQRRSAATSPSMAEGVVICPTSAGAVVAVDAAARAILWGRGYPVSTDRRRMMRFQIARIPEQGPLPVTSVDATASIADGHVLLAPVEADVLLCLDLFSGDLVWSRPLSDLLYIGGVVGKTVVTVGERALSAWHLDTGKPAWTELAVELPDGAKTAGRGVMAGETYFVPTTAPGLLKVHTATGRIEPHLSLGGKPAHPLGNLVAVGALLVSQSDEAIQAFTAVPAESE